MKLHILGVNGPYPESNGATSGYLLEAADTLLQLDFGSGILARLTAKLPPQSLSAILLSHWHYDHTADLLVLSYLLQQLNQTLHVYAPVDEASPLRKIIAESPYFELTDVAPGDAFTIGSCAVRVGEARHPVPTVGYRIESDGRVFGFTGDTNTLPSLKDFYLGCSLLLADALFPAEAWTEAKPHLSAPLAAQLACDAGAEKLVLTHLNPACAPRQLLRQAQAIHPSVTLASPGAVLSV